MKRIIYGKVDYDIDKYWSYANNIYIENAKVYKNDKEYIECRTQSIVELISDEPFVFVDHPTKQDCIERDIEHAPEAWIIQEANIQLAFSSKEFTINDLQNYLIFASIGELNAIAISDGYSEFTPMAMDIENLTLVDKESYVTHDLKNIFYENDGKYMMMVIEAKGDNE